MMYFDERLSEKSVDVVGSNNNTVLRDLDDADDVVVVERVEHANFQTARVLELARKQLLEVLCELPVTALWLLDNYEQEAERHKTPEIAACLAAIKEQYAATIQEPTCVETRQQLATVLQTFPFGFEDLSTLSNIIIHAFKANGLSNDAEHSELVSKRLESCKPRNKPCFTFHGDETFLFSTATAPQHYVVDLVNAEHSWLTARQNLATANSKLVLFIANQYKSSFLDFDDLVQEGQTGLLKAVDRFNPHLGFQFSTYASYWIRKSISRALSRCERVVRVPCGQIATINKVFRAKEELLLKLGRDATIQELAQHTQLTDSDIHHILAIAQTASALEGFDNDDEETSFAPIDFLEQQVFSPPFREIAQSHLENLLNEAIKMLNPREARIICSHFGVDSDAEMTLQEIGSELNLTRERVRQIQVAALNKIKHCYGKQLSSFL